MCYFLYLIFCCKCFGGKYVKKEDPELKHKHLSNLEEIKPETVKKISSDPLAVSTEGMTDYHRIPNSQFQSEAEVIASYGYEIGVQLGEGTFAKVFKAKIIDKDISVAVKICNIPEVMKTSEVTDKISRMRKLRKKRLTIIKKEVFVLQEIRHPHIIQLIQHFIIAQKSITNIYIFMQLAEHGDLSTLLKSKGPFDETTSKLWFAQILSAMVYMHNRGIAHRDLKLLNILLDISDDALVTDFGLSQVVERRTTRKTVESKTYCGTPPYMAPEIIEKKEASVDLKMKTYDPFAVDVWALGVILYTLLNKCHPFHREDESQYVEPLKRMLSKNWKFTAEMSKPANPELEDLLTKIFEPQPQMRPKVFNLSEHKWVSDVFKEVEEKCKKWIELRNI